MTSWDITIDLPPADVITLLRDMPDAEVLHISTGIGIGFGEGRAAWVDDEPSQGDPEDQTYICVKDYMEMGGWQIYAFLETHTDVPMSMTDYGGVIVRDRHRMPYPPEYTLERGAVQLHVWDSREVGASLLINARSTSMTPAEALRIVGASEPPPWQLRDRTSEVVSALVRAGLLTPVPIAHETPGHLAAWTPPEAWGRQRLALRANSFFPREGERRMAVAGNFVAGPALIEHGPAPIARSDVVRWLTDDAISTEDMGAGG